MRTRRRRGRITLELPLPAGVVAPSETHLLGVEVDEAVVGDGALCGCSARGRRGHWRRRQTVPWCRRPSRSIAAMSSGTLRMRGACRLEAIVARHAQLAVAVGDGEEVEILARGQTFRQGGGAGEDGIPVSHGGELHHALAVRAQGATSVTDTVEPWMCCPRFCPPGVQHHGRCRCSPPSHRHCGRTRAGSWRRR